MTKPVIASDLLNEVLRQFGQVTNVGPQQPIATSSPRVHPRRVLLVEDNEINRRVALGLLRSRGHHAVVAENGREAVDAVAQQEFDVVLMDMQMPVMDGYEATIHIREREQHSGGHIPIVAMTAEALKGDRERCLATGMDDYVSKPITPAAMYRAIEKFPAVCLQMNLNVPRSGDKSNLVTQNTSAAGNTEGSALPSDSSLQTSSTPSFEVSIVDWQATKKLIGDDEARLKEFTDLLKTEASQRMADIRQAIAVNDSKLLRRAAHTLKGACSYFGTEPVIKASFDLEQLGKSESFDNADKMLEILEKELARLLTALEAGPPA